MMASEFCKVNEHAARLLEENYKTKFNFIKCYNPARQFLKKEE
jgi:hypothetical protein